MSSPRKYASPYLTGIPGLSVATTKTKKRSKTSLTRIYDPSVTEADASDSQAATKNSKDSPATSNQIKEPRFDASCGDMEQKVMNDIINGTKPIAVVSTNDEKSDTDAPGLQRLLHHLRDSLHSSTISALMNTECTTEEGSNAADLRDFSNDSKKTLQNSENETKHLTAEGDQPKMSVTKEVAQLFSLKSILKKPSLYKVKSKTKETNNDNSKKQGKTSKVKGGKTAKENSARAPAKQKFGGNASASAAKLETTKGQISSKSPRRHGRAKADISKPEETVSEIPLFLRKSVRFSNKVDVHPVPYESRAGTRACDWQRNMLEQRVQTFRQLMKDVGSDEIDLFGSGMLFPGYPYHLPSPNFTIRGSRIRNFKL